jgi:hypothetical protein
LAVLHVVFLLDLPTFNASSKPASTLSILSHSPLHCHHFCYPLPFLSLVTVPTIHLPSLNANTTSSKKEKKKGGRVVGTDESRIVMLGF